MRKSIFIPAVVLTSLMTITSVAKIGHSLFSQHNQRSKARFDSLWVNYDISQGGVKGMLIHLKFSVYDLKGVDCQVNIQFFDPDDGTILKDKNQKYYNTSGNVVVQTKLKPKSSKTVYKDLQLFMPYDEFHLAPGKYKLTMDMALSWGPGIFEYEQLTFYNFTYTQPAFGAINSSKKQLSLDKFWIDYYI